MNVTFVDPGADTMISRIMAFQTEAGPPFGQTRYSISSLGLTRPMSTVSLFQKGETT